MTECEVDICTSDGEHSAPSKKLNRMVPLCRIHLIHAMNRGYLDCGGCGRPYGRHFSEGRVFCNGCMEKANKIEGRVAA